ncbi:MAG: hypothetical protein KDA41_16830 [Planctomycetales bacterium]|nr:hypothetical protein [Planctomycetales bacterium]
MQQIPIPTDSLYKWIAISGIVIGLTTFLYLESQSTKLTSEKVAILGEQRMAEYDARRLGAQATRLTRSINAELKLGNDEVFKSVVLWEVVPSDDDASTASASSNLHKAIFDMYVEKIPLGTEISPSVQKQIDALLDCASDVDAQQIAIANKLFEAQTLEMRIERYRRLSWLFVSCGGIMFGLGSFLWFFNIQRFQDRIIVLEATRR